MTKRNILCAFASFLVMIGLPWCAITFVRGDGGMAVCLLLFFIINPVFSIYIGVFTGKNRKASWFQPLLSAILFLLGTWAFFEMGEDAFILYALIYSGLGYITALISWLILKNST